MAQSDFNFYASSTGWGTPIPVSGTQGAACLNSSLSNPLASSTYGTRCREYRMESSNVPVGLAVWNGFVSSSNFVGLPNTKKVSLRAVVRTKNGVQPLNNNINVGLRARTNPSNHISGYSLTLGTLNNYQNYAGTTTVINPYFGSYGLYLSLKKPDGGKDNSFPDVLVLGGLSYDTWYPIRMDVIPDGDTKDTINIYTGSMDIDGNITWSSIVYTTDVTNGQTVHNPASAGLCCGYTVMGGNILGHVDTSNPGRGYIDNLDIRVSNV